MTEFVKVTQVGDVPQGEGKVIELEGKKIAIFNLKGNFYAIDDTCSHADASLCDGPVDEETGEAICPWHGARFKIATGEALCAPARTDLATYPLRVVDNEIEIQI